MIDDDKVEVTVNDKPVVLEGARQTGTGVKRAAIEQGVQIDEGIVLGVDLGDGKAKCVADDEEIVVREGERFLVVETGDRVEVTVNDKPVVLEGMRQTGAGVKRAAIEQGVQIGERFVLSIELDGEAKPVADDERIVVHAGERFLAVEKGIKVEVAVNDKPVVLEGAQQTGASIKRTAVEQGVQIADDFVLSIELGGGKTKLVGDDDEIVVRAGERFLAIENDDNS